LLDGEDPIVSTSVCLDPTIPATRVRPWSRGLWRLLEKYLTISGVIRLDISSRFWRLNSVNEHLALQVGCKSDDGGDPKSKANFARFDSSQG
jgi:hypothetical protein